MEKYIPLTREDLPFSYDLLPIPVVKEEHRSPGQGLDGSLMRSAYYFVEVHRNSDLYNGKPYGIVRIGYRTVSHPDHFDTYCSRFYSTLEEARLRAQLATWFRVMEDSRAEDLAFEEHDVCCDLRLLEFLSQAKFAGVTLDERKWKNGEITFQKNLLAPMPDLSALPSLEHPDANWRACWNQQCPNDPLDLIVWRIDTHFPTIDWLATIRRVAATVADREPSPCFE